MRIANRAVRLRLVCIMQTGLPLSEKTFELLYRTCRQMIAYNRKQQQAANEDCDGIVRTEFERTRFLGFSGIEFSCNLALKNGQTEVRFLVRD